MLLGYYFREVVGDPEIPCLFSALSIHGSFSSVPTSQQRALSSSQLVCVSLSACLPQFLCVSLSLSRHLSPTKSYTPDPSKQPVHPWTLLMFAVPFIT